MILVVILGIIILILIFYFGASKPKGYPPGPRWWPILGSALEVDRIRKETGHLDKTCTVLSEKYGPVVGLKIGSDQIVVLNDLESIKTTLIHDDCDGRPVGPVFEARTFGKRLGVLFTDGDLWLKQRRFVVRHLREFGLGKNNMATMIEEEASYLVNNLMKRFEAQYSDQILIKNNIKLDLNAKCSDSMDQFNSEDLKPKEILDWDKAPDILNQRDFKRVLTIEDMYVKPEQFDDVQKASRSSELIIQMDDIFGVPILNTLWRMMAGKRFNQNDKQLNHLQKILTALFKEIDIIGALFGHFPILRYIAPEASGYKKFMETHQELWDFLNEELMEHKEKFDPNAPKDLIDCYLKMLKSEDVDETFSEPQLLAICIDLFMAGSETTTKALNFCFLYLILNPEIQRKAQEEIDQVIGYNRRPSLSDRPRMTYVNAISLECIRIFMGRTMNVPRRATKDTYIQGYRIPKNTMIAANFSRILMDESWGDPEVFRPERFIDSEGSIKVPERFMAFGIGQHRCMGEVLAKNNIFVFIATLLQAFTFSVVSPDEKPSTDYEDGVTSSPLPFEVLIRKRN